MNIAGQKAELRRTLLSGRSPTHSGDGNLLARNALAELDFTLCATIAGVWPMAGEMDLRPLLHALHARGHTIVLPETLPRGQVLTFRRWAPGTAMLPGRFGTFHTDGAPAVPDLLFVPLLAFDRSGNRIGYGGGYYDRTLAALPDRPAIGFGRADQEIALVPTETHDRRLATILTEREVIRTAAA